MRDAERVDYLDGHLRALAPARSRPASTYAGTSSGRSSTTSNGREGYSKRFGIVYVDYETLSASRRRARAGTRGDRPQWLASARRRWPCVGAAAGRRAPTLEEVGEVAGVSRATVSRVINNSPQGEPRGARRPSSARSRSSATRRTRPRGASSRGAPTRSRSSCASRRRAFFSDPFFAGVVRGVASAAAELDKNPCCSSLQGEAGAATVRGATCGPSTSTACC